ncbi:DNA cytosine methyltransferase [Sinorhizobium meliloti]|nr:DNA cytosine methyltransferase [Sinorhizobium meliloti]
MRRRDGGVNVALRPEHLNIISLCTGGGGLDLGIELAIQGTRAVCMVEREAFAVSQLVSAMEAGLMAPAPIWSDARSFNGRAWRGAVDGVIGGIPCQPHSLAGKRLGEEDERDLWSTARRIIVQSGAWFVLIENVRGMLSSGGAERVWRDLCRLGFTPEGGLFTASECGLPHERERFFILAVADRNGEGLEGYGVAGECARELPPGQGCGQLADPACLDEWRHRKRRQDQAVEIGGHGLSLFPPERDDFESWRAIIDQSPHLEPAFRRVADGLASRLDIARVDRLRMLGNGVVPLQAAYAIRTLVTRLAARGSAGAARLVRMMEMAA